MRKECELEMLSAMDLYKNVMMKFHSIIMIIHLHVPVYHTACHRSTLSNDSNIIRRSKFAMQNFCQDNFLLFSLLVHYLHEVVNFKVVGFAVFFLNFSSKIWHTSNLLLLCGFSTMAHFCPVLHSNFFYFGRTLQCWMILIHTHTYSVVMYTCIYGNRLERLVETWSTH